MLVLGGEKKNHVGLAWRKKKSVHDAYAKAVLIIVSHFQNNTNSGMSF